MTKKATEAIHVLGVSLHRGSERPWCEGMKVKPGLCWRSQDVGDARAVGYLQGEMQTGCGTIPEERSVLQSTS